MAAKSVREREREVKEGKTSKTQKKVRRASMHLSRIKIFKNHNEVVVKLGAGGNTIATRDIKSQEGMKEGGRSNPSCYT